MSSNREGASSVVFEGWQARAAWEGTKTVMRVPLSAQPPTMAQGRWSVVVGSTNGSEGTWCYRAPDPAGTVFTERGREVELASERCPFGRPGSVLWVQESAYIAPPGFGDSESGNALDRLGRPRTVSHVASMDGDARRCAEELGVERSAPSAMPRWASRMELLVVDVRVERLREIDGADAAREGVAPTGRNDAPAVVRFAEAWDVAHPAARWETNPWVFRVEFTRRKVGGFARDPEIIRPEEIVAWLAYLAHEGETLSEGELAAAIGGDRIAARDLVIRGRDVAERVRDARVNRIRREVGQRGDAGGGCAP